MAVLSFDVFSRGHDRAELGESPCWDPQTGAVWWVDITGRRLLRTAIASGETAGWATPEMPGFVILRGPDSAAIGMQTGIFAFAPGTGAFERLVPFDAAGCRFNDATVDGRGRLWASTMMLDAGAGAGSIHRVTPDLALDTVVRGLATPNGMAVDLDRERFLYSDSHPDVQSIWSLPIGRDGTPAGAAGLFARTRDLPGRPDGAALAADGSYWLAGVDGSALYLYGPDGRRDATIAVPFPAPTKPCFAGHDGRTLVVTSKGIGDSGGFLARAQIPPEMAAGIVQPYWTDGLARPASTLESS